MAWLNRTAPSATGKDLYEGLTEVRQAESIQHGVDEAVARDEHKVQVSQPMNELTAAHRAQIHEVDHDARGPVCQHKGGDHHQIRLGDLLFPFNCAHARAILLALRLVLPQVFKLCLELQENPDVAEHQNGEREEKGQICQNEGIGNETHLEKRQGESQCGKPNAAGNVNGVLKCGVRAVPER